MRRLFICSLYYTVFTFHMRKLHHVQQFLMIPHIVSVFISFNEMSCKGLRARYSIYWMSVELCNHAFWYQVILVTRTTNFMLVLSFELIPHGNWKTVFKIKNYCLRGKWCHVIWYIFTDIHSHLNGRRVSSLGKMASYARKWEINSGV
jgi:hypothetical protein